MLEKEPQNLVQNSISRQNIPFNVKNIQKTFPETRSGNEYFFLLPTMWVISFYESRLS